MKKKMTMMVQLVVCIASILVPVFLPQEQIEDPYTVPTSKHVNDDKDGNFKQQQQQQQQPRE